jgi:hypothetical protein
MMLRFVYRCVLRAHPAWFRDRFSDEMLSIFDETQGPLTAIRLLGDGLFSLVRQWALRPEFGNELTISAAAPEAPFFYTFENRKPRTQALLYGAFLSLFVLHGACWTMGYAWNHPSFVWIQPPVISPPQSGKAKLSAPPAGTAAGDEILSTDAGRVLLVFRSHNHALPAGNSGGEMSRSDPSAPVSTGQPFLNTQPVVSGDADIDLKPYIGRYVENSARANTVRVTLEDGHLELEIVGQFRSSFVPVSPTRFVAVGMNDCWIEFAKARDERVIQVLIQQGTRQIVAIRQ